MRLGFDRLVNFLTLDRLTFSTVALFLLTGGLLSIEVSFRAVSNNLADSKLKLLTSAIMEPRVFANSYLLAQTIEGIESSGILACTTLARLNQSGSELRFWQRRACGGSLYRDFIAGLLLTQQAIELQFKGPDGNMWRVQTYSQNQGSFLFALWFARLAFIGLVLLSVLILSLIRKAENQRVVDKLEFQKKSYDEAKRLAHDIRSPLSVIQLCAGNFESLHPEGSKMLGSAAKRIDDIANSFLTQRKKAAQTQKPFDVADLVESVIREKEIEHKDKRFNIELRNKTQNLLLSVDSGELARSVSNLLNNSLDAIRNDTGAIVVEIKTSLESVTIEITDNGPGIPHEILSKIGTQGFTLGKGSKGNGLGVYQAREWVNSIGGRLEISSAVGTGTRVRLIIPMTS